MKLFRKILIANRGEIAVRVMKTAHRMGMKTVAIYAKNDQDSLHVSMAGEAHCIGEGDLGETYLNIRKIIDIAIHTQCEAIHPGYGFLSENPEFVKVCEKEGLVFIGPQSETMQLMGNKIAARQYIKTLDIPVIEGFTGTQEELHAHEMEFPVLVKAAAGGGGKGMRIVQHADELPAALEATSREAKAYFGDETVYLERYLEEPRHIEFQILGDKFGNIIHLFERECSLQRRYQKIIEEAPSPTLDEALRTKMGEAAVKIGQETHYTSAGTIEFLVDKNLYFYFLEMNTRVQVEHPVTELTTGVDIVEQQILIAAGNELQLSQEALVQNGHAIECRVYAESPENNFLPSPGKMTLYREPQGEHIRIDTGLTPGTAVKPQYDPMICKLAVWGENRAEATGRSVEALKNFAVHGIHTNILYLISLLESEDFVYNDISTRYCDVHTQEIVKAMQKKKSKIDKSIPVAAFLLFSLKADTMDTKGQHKHDVWKIIGYWRLLMDLQISLDEVPFTVQMTNLSEKQIRFHFEDRLHQATLISLENGKMNFMLDEQSYTVFVSAHADQRVEVSVDGCGFHLQRKDLLPGNDTPPAEIHASDDEENAIISPMPGTVIKINVSEGDKVKKGDVLLIVESMKMENNILAAGTGTVKKLNVSTKDMVDKNTVLVILENEG